MPPPIRSKSRVLTMSEYSEKVPLTRVDAYSGRDWTKGSILRNLVALSWPMIVSNTLNVLGPTVDMIWVGKLGPEDIAAVGVAGLVVQLVNALIMGLFTGLRSMIARHIGAGDKGSAVHVVQQAFALAGIYAVVLAAVGIVFAEPILDALGLSPAVIALGAPYLRIQFIGMAAMTFRTLTDGTMQASGDTITPMKIAVVFRAIHLALCPFLVFGWWIFPKLEVNGAAYTGIVSQTLGTLLGMWILTTGQSRLKLTLRRFRFDLSTILRINRIGIPASVMALQMQFGQLILMRVVAPFGDLAVAAHTLAQRVDFLLFMPLMGIGMSSGVLVGQNLGAHQPQRAERNGWIALALSEAILGTAAIIIFFFASGTVHIFSSDPSLDSIASSYLRIACAAYAVAAFNMVLQQCIAGAGDTVPPMIISIISIWALQVPLAFVFSGWDKLGFFGIRWAMVTGSVFGAICYVIYFRRGRWKEKKI
jgi:putative MATE family efflux protein